MNFIKLIVSYPLKLFGYKLVKIEDSMTLYRIIKNKLKKTGILYSVLKRIFLLISYVYYITKYVFNIILKKKFYNMSIDDSRENWRKHLIKSSNKEYTNWRGPSHIACENIPFVQDYLKSKSKEYQSILDIGSYDGYFTKHYLKFKKIYCADLFKESGDLIKKEYGSDINFILLNGFDLKDIKNDTVDLVFSFDSLDRAPRKSIINYFKEFNRIMRNGGELFVRIPSCYHLETFKRGFTFISPKRAIKELINFEAITVNYDISAYGPVLQAKKATRNKD